MKIAMTDAYAYERRYDCDRLENCQRLYCSIHRILYRSCDAIQRGIEGDQDVINGVHGFIEIGDCPSCQAESRKRECERWVKEAV